MYTELQRKQAPNHMPVFRGKQVQNQPNGDLSEGFVGTMSKVNFESRSGSPSKQAWTWKHNRT